jgi:hypothetical protein
MNKFISDVKVLIGDKLVMLNSLYLTFGFIVLEMKNENLQEIRDFNAGQASGLEIDIKISCRDNKFPIHEKTYRAKISSIYRCSATRIESKLSFVGLTGNQKLEIKNTIAALALSNFD